MGVTGSIYCGMGIGGSRGKVWNFLEFCIFIWKRGVELEFFIFYLFSVFDGSVFIEFFG